MAAESVVLVDEQGGPVGTAPKTEVHHSETPLHLGFSCYVVDADDRLLVTRRALTKQTFPGVWTNSFCGHPAPGEPLEDAVRRRAADELGLTLERVDVVLPGFRYRAEMDGVVELEVCPVTVARVAVDPELLPRADEVDTWEWVPWSRFAAEVVDGSREVSVWCAEQTPLLLALGEPAGWAATATARGPLPAALRPPHVAAPATAAAPDAAARSAAAPAAPAAGRDRDRLVVATVDKILADRPAVTEGGAVPPNPSAVEHTLAATDDLLADVCRRLAATWHDRSGDALPVLREDLPELLHGWLLPPSGKRLRPVMAHWGWAVSGGTPETRQHLVATCAALELVHLFALVHDDVMDRSDSRRGRVTVHVEAAKAHAGSGALGDPGLFGDSVAILFGDLALTEAWALVAGLGSELREAWAEMLRELVQGQLLDITGAAGRARELQRARRVARLKSGAYTVQRPLELGALAAGAPSEVVSALGAFGEHLGEAFALRDDVLGVWGDPRRTGKPVGDDLLSAKPTVLLAEAAQLLPPDVAERYLGAGGAITPDDVPVVQQLMLDAGVLSRVEDRITAEVELAHAALESAALDPDAAQQLRGVAASIAWRES